MLEFLGRVGFQGFSLFCEIDLELWFYRNEPISFLKLPHFLFSSVMTERDGHSMMLFTHEPQSVSTNLHAHALGVELMLLGGKEKLTAAEELNALRCVMAPLDYEKTIMVAYRLCGACSIRLQGDSICKHCRCKTCQEWKVCCRCGPDERWENNRSIHGWMKRGFIKHTREQDGRITSHCVICRAQLTKLTAPFLRCVTCIGRTI